ncbi:MAG: MarR family transcriptional regulator [Moraxella sp.]|nr:MarR family transcriptional regulator [Moraxella sp.]
MKLTPTTEKFILHWGEMGSKWGVNRTVAQIHALLFLADKPMNAEDITQVLGVARSNVSTSIKELQSLNLVQTTHILGDRRDYFTTNHDVWELAKIIVQERYQRELAPTVVFLTELINSDDFALENSNVQQRIKDTYNFVDTLTTWANEMLKLSINTLAKVLKLGASIQKFLK